MNAADFDLRGHVETVLAGLLPVGEFRQWFARALWEAESGLDDDTLTFAYLIENRVAELASGNVDESQWVNWLRAEFARREHVFVFPALGMAARPAALVRTGTSAPTGAEHRPVVLAFGRSPAAVPA